MGKISPVKPFLYCSFPRTENSLKSSALSLLAVDVRTRSLSPTSLFCLVAQVVMTRDKRPSCHFVLSHNSLVF